MGAPAILLDWLLKRALSSLVQHGSLDVRIADGAVMNFGDGGQPSAAIRFADHGAAWAFLLDPDLRLGELYMDQRLVVERGDLYDVLVLLMRDSEGKPDPAIIRLLDRSRFAIRRFVTRIGRKAAVGNVAHHYDLNAGLYDLFLDADRQYSCAYFPVAGMSIEQAQLAKKRHIAAKLCLAPELRILDIGCGWGGMALYLAEAAKGAQVLGVTLSKEQIVIARERAAKAGIADRVEFAMCDYRDVKGSFDRIVSVGMFEHVGKAQFDAFFAKTAQSLALDGVMLLHTIGQSDGPGAPNPWLTKYIFPGGYLPALSELTAAVERSGLIVTDVEVLRLHYAETLRQWRARFMARRAEALQLYDERFCLMWEFYLALCEAAFHYQGVAVFQVQIARRQTAVPLTRDYITAAEAAILRR